MSRHQLWMIAGCVLAVLVLFLLPALGFSGDVSIAGFLILVLGCHLMHFAVQGRHGDRQGGAKR